MTENAKERKHLCKQTLNVILYVLAVEKNKESARKFRKLWFWTLGMSKIYICNWQSNKRTNWINENHCSNKSRDSHTLKLSGKQQSLLLKKLLPNINLNDFMEYLYMFISTISQTKTIEIIKVKFVIWFCKN